MEITRCPNCNNECDEINFTPIKDLSGWTLKPNEEGRLIGYKNENDGTTINPYPKGGTQLICKDCCLYTFYPRM